MIVIRWPALFNYRIDCDGGLFGQRPKILLLRYYSRIVSYSESAAGSRRSDAAISTGA
jgi:hypothetical protein